MNRRVLFSATAFFCALAPLIAVSGCGKNDAGSTANIATPTPPANLPPAIQERRAAEERGRAADAKAAATSPGAKFRK